MLTIEENDVSKTLQVSKWLSSDVVKFDKIRIKHNLKINKEVFDLMVSKLRNFPEHLKETLGLNYKIEFKNYNGLVKACIPYKENPIEFYKWWINNSDCIKMTFKEKIELFDKVNLLDKSILKVEHKLKIGK
jgi:ATP-dependent DNA helicase RecQ